MKQIIFMVLIFSPFFGCGEENSLEQILEIDFSVKVLDSQQLTSSSEDRSFTFRIRKSDEGYSFFAWLGCNNILGTVENVNRKIKFSQIISTKKMCPNISVEEKFISLLEKVNSFEIKEDSLILSMDKQRLIKMEKANANS